MKKKSSPGRRRPTPAKVVRRKTPAPPAGAAFPIIGIGASAGGSRPWNNSSGHVPKASRMALVIVQHLDPTRKGIMAELLQRTTRMKVIQVKDRTKVRPDCVYVIPPNKDMSILHGVLHLLEPVSPRGLRLPIDFFLRSLAQDQQEHSIAVILSGMGSDGTLGLRAIKEKAGVVLVQDPATAKFNGMPRSAIDAGLADIVAPVEELPGRILAYLKRTPLIRGPEQVLEDKTQSTLDKAIILLRTHTGHDFSLYKKNTFYRRIERRMGIHQIDKIASYIRYLQENSQELDLLFKELLIGVTNFFRDGAAWEELRKKVLPALIASRPNGHVLRAWVPGCSTGEEAYSLAMVIKEAMDRIKPRKKLMLQVFATDLDKDAIDKARQGVYPENICADVSPKQMSRFFKKEEHGCRVTSEIREMVVFAPQNLIMDPPFTKLDILSCRNLLIYLAPEMQKKLIPLFHYSLIPGGILLLGSAETVGTFTDLFVPLNNKLRIFRRTKSALRPEPIEFPSSFASRPARRNRGAPGAKTAEPAVPGGSTGPGTLLPARGARERPGQRAVRQRPDRQIPGTRRRQGELEHFCHGPRRPALRSRQRLPQGAGAGRGRGPPWTQSRNRRRETLRGRHNPAAQGTGDAAGAGDDRVCRSGRATGNQGGKPPGAGRKNSRPQRPAGGTRTEVPAGPHGGASHP